jgi:arylsulfatase
VADRGKLGALCALALLAACSGEPRLDLEGGGLGRRGGPVVVIVLDALHAAHLGHLGYDRDTSPHLDALAAEGVTFEHAFAPAPYTNAAIPSLLTGRLPDHHGVVKRDRMLAPVETTLAELFQAAGYATHGAVANMNGASDFGCDQGFETYVETFREHEGRIGGPSRGEGKMRLPLAAEFAPILRAWVEEAEDPRRSLFYLHVLEPHEPYDPPAEFRELWLDEDYAGPFVGHPARAMQLLDMSRRAGTELPEADRQALLDLYDGNIANVDAAVGAMLDVLRDAELLDDALIVVTSDHGEAFWQHGEQGHNTQLYDPMLRVPLIVRFPGEDAPRGVRVRRMVSILDLVPSLCRWFDLGLPELPLDGLDLTEAIAAPDELWRERKLLLRNFSEPPVLGVRTDTTKSILHPPAAAGQRATVEHYRLDEDPGETRDHGFRAGEPDLAHAAVWITNVEPTAVPLDGELSMEEEAHLRDLGYAE